MRVLVYPHDLNMGGSQTNAIEIAAKIREFGVESIIFGRPGVLNSRIDELGLEFIESPNPGRRPSIKIAKLLRSIAKERKIDVLHGYEWPPSLECVAAAYGLENTVSISTVMSMAVAPFIPKTMPLVVGTEQIAAAERQAGRRNVSVIEPPVDLDHNVAPPEAELAAFRRHWGLRPDATLVVCVSRLANELKSEGILSAIQAVGDQLADIDLHFLIVGDGPARDQIRAAADEANAKTQPDRVIMTGELLDPRPAYAVAHIVLGMGGSALRALAFSKPLIVQGEQGFFEILNEHTLGIFQWQGWYGIGTGGGPERVACCVRSLWARHAERIHLGQLGRSTLVRRFSLDAAAGTQLAAYRSTLSRAGSPRTEVVAMGGSAARFATHTVKRKLTARLSHTAADDFNAKPVATRLTEAPSRIADSGAVIYLAGAQWDDVPATDAHLARALGELRPVIWIDPTSSVLRRLEGSGTPVISQVAPGVTRLHASGPPGVTRAGVRAFARMWTGHVLRRHINRTGTSIDAVISTSPEPLLDMWREFGTQRIYFATDDFVAGADLMGLSESHLRLARERNLDAADLALAVTPELAEALARPGKPVQVFSNGCNLGRYAPVPRLTASSEVTIPSPRAGVIGQLNQRLDLACLEAVADGGTSILLVGPLIDRDDRFAMQFRSLVSRPNVQWLDQRPPDALPELMAALVVGLTPYVDDGFNRASFPLKTLDYLAAGLPVVSTDLPSARRLDPRFVVTAALPCAFREAVNAAVAAATPPDPTEVQRSIRRYSWDRRAAELDQIIRGRIRLGDRLGGTATSEELAAN